MQDNHDRQARCWRDADLIVLKGRGEDTGLSVYLEAVRSALVPMLKPGPIV